MSLDLLLGHLRELVRDRVPWCLELNIDVFVWSDLRIIIEQSGRHEPRTAVRSDWCWRSAAPTEALPIGGRSFREGCLKCFYQFFSINQAEIFPLYQQACSVS